MVYISSPNTEATIVAELEDVPGALAPVTWEIIHTIGDTGPYYAHICKAKPQGDDYIALSHLFYISNDAAGEPPAHLTKGFRAVHKSVVEPATFLKNETCRLGNLGDVAVWVTDNGIMLAPVGQKPLDKPYKLKVSQTTPIDE